MNFIRRILSALQEPPATEESLREMYSSMPDHYLKTVNPSELTPVARKIYDEELKRRAQGGNASSKAASN